MSHRKLCGQGNGFKMMTHFPLAVKTFNANNVAKYTDCYPSKHSSCLLKMEDGHGSYVGCHSVDYAAMLSNATTTVEE
jgi:hypothetical protein